MKKFGLLLVSLLSAVLFAKATTVDSLGIGEYKGKAVILHLIESKENYYSISRKYHVNPSELMSFNDNTPIRIGDTLKVYKTNLSLKKNQTAFNEPEGKPIEHSVTSKETMFSIAKKYNVGVDDIKTWNHLTENGLKVGQKLKIIPKTKATSSETATSSKVETVAKTEKPEEVKVIAKTTTTTASTKNEPVEQVSTIETPSEPTSTTAKAGREVHESGMATWISDNDLNQAKSVALHRSAPMGTIVKITNPMTSKSVFVKVVGNFPESSDTKNVLIVISKSAASLLGVRDQKFRIDLSYAM